MERRPPGDFKSIRGALLFLATHGQCLDGSEGEGEGDDKQKEKRIGAVSLFADLLSSSSGGGRRTGSEPGVSITASGLLSAFSRHTQDEEELGEHRCSWAVLAANGVSAYHLNCQLYVLSSISERVLCLVALTLTKAPTQACRRQLFATWSGEDLICSTMLEWAYIPTASKWRGRLAIMRWYLRCATPRWQTHMHKHQPQPQSQPQPQAQAQAQAQAQRL